MPELTYDAAFPSRFIKAETLGGQPRTLTISKAYMEVLEGEKGKENKLILGFEGKDRELVACKTNAFCLKEMFGGRIADWVGKRVTFFPTKVAFGPRMVDGIRISGSPDIAADIPVSARIGKKQFKTTLKAMRAGVPTQTATPPPAPTDQPDNEGNYDFGENPDAEPFDHLSDAPDLEGEMVP